MTATLEPGCADEVYVVGLEPRHYSAPLRVLRGLADLWCAASGGRMELSRAGDLVVRRRHDGGEELRVPLPAPDAVPELLAVVHEQLETLDPAEFRKAWGLPALA
ncbi:hypothetical protein [Nocardioides nanhaiensis]|uniref:Transcriptional regulator n=1 Tax=Nocardioides nanhaiensis TaxID=1476871 RepID=A0ABP8W4Z5_9ACTN